MKGLEYMPYFVDKYDAATAHLTFEEDGVYVRLLRLCWRTPGGTIPDDPLWIARRMRCEMNTYHALVEPIIKEFFRRDRGRIYQKRLKQEWDRSTELARKRSVAGSLGGRPANPRKTKETI